MAKYFVNMVNVAHELDSQQYENLRNRTLSNRSGFYEIKTGPSAGFVVGMAHLVSLHIERTPQEIVEAEEESRKPTIDMSKHDETKKPKKRSCKVDHKAYQKYTKFNAEKEPNKDWPDELDVYLRVTKTGGKQYVPRCNKCGKMMPIVKPQTVPRIFGYDTIDDVKPIDEFKRLEK